MAETKVTQSQMANDDLTKQQVADNTVPSTVVASTATAEATKPESPEVVAQKAMIQDQAHTQALENNALIQQQTAKIKDDATGEVAQTGGATIQAAQQENVTKAVVSTTPGVTSAVSAIGVAPKQTETVTATTPKATTATTPAKTVETSTTKTTQSVVDGAKTAVTGNKSSDELFADLQNMKFTYDSATDSEYRQEASRLENDVAQMMVGRGMLYSSVAQSALQSRLIASQINFRKQAYDNWLQERNFMFTTVQYQAGREDAAFQKEMSVKQYNAGREDAAFSKKMSLANYALAKDQQAFSQSMQRQQLALQQSNAAYNRRKTEALETANQTRANLQTDIAKYSNDNAEFEKMKAAWSKNGYATPEIAAYFGIQGYGGQYAHAMGALYGSSGTIMAKKQAELDAQAKNIYNTALQYKQDDIAMGYLTKWMEEAKLPEVDYTGANLNLLGTSTQQSYYTSELAKLTDAMTNDTLTGLAKRTPKQIYADAQARYNTYENTMGTYLAQRLMEDLKRYT